MKAQTRSTPRLLVLLVIGLLVTGLALSAYYRQTVLASGPGESSLAEASQGWVDAFAAKDGVGVSSYFAQEVIAMYPLDTVPMIGSETNQENWVQAFEIFESHPITSDTVVVANSKDVGYTYGRWAATGIPDLGEAAGRYVATWEWTKSGWKITVLSAHIHEDVLPSDVVP